MQVSDKTILEKADLSAETTRKPYSAECVYEKAVHVIFPTEHSRLERVPSSAGVGALQRKCEGQGQKRTVQMFSAQFCLLSVCWTSVLTLPSSTHLSLVKTSPVSPVTEPKLWFCGTQEL